MACGQTTLADRTLLVNSLESMPKEMMRVGCMRSCHSERSAQDPQALVADVVDHPLRHQEVGQLGQAPGCCS
jgi:hypothetical protein